MKDRRVTIFEAVNRTLQEVYVGMTEEGLQRAMARHRSSPPSQISHWRADHAVEHCSVELNLAASRAEEFIAAHVRKIARPGWKILAGAAPQG